MLGAVIEDERGLAKYSTKSSGIPCGCDKTLTGRSDLSIPNTLIIIPYFFINKIIAILKQADPIPKSIILKTFFPVEFEISRIALPEIDFRVVCSKGTYIRSLAFDFGKALNSGAHLITLRRTKIGDYHVESAIEVNQFEANLQGH